MSRRKEAIDARDNILDRLRIEGLEAAFRRAIKILNDDDVPATAQAGVVRAVFQAGGVMDHNPTDELEREAHEMTYDELQATIARIRANMEGREDEGGGSFD